MSEITRRSFLTGSTTAVVAAAVGGLASTALAEEAAPAADPTDSCDVLIVGAGGAGLSAAIEAADAGASVLVIDKNTVTGGTTSVSQGLIGGFDTQIQKAQGVELTYEQMYDNLAANASYRLDPELMGITIEKCGESVDWLIDRCNVAFLDEAQVGYGPYEMMHVVDGVGFALAETLTKTAEESGVNIRVNTKATEIVMDGERPVAVKATDTQTGEEITLGFKALIITTGGYSCNPELAARFTPEVAGTLGIGHPMATGDGIIMASNIGACTSHTDSMMCVLKDYEIMTEYTPTSEAADVNGFSSLPNMILVGAEGKRFYNEDDSGYMRQAYNSPVFDQMHKDGLDYVWMVSDQAAVDANGGRTHRGEDLEYVTGDTPAELAAAMGVDPDGLTETIDAYNAAVDAGFDPEFGRMPTVKLEAPYVALATLPCSIITYGGIARDRNSQVIRADGSLIPGMYCAGETSCNSAFMGFTISNAITWGRISGANAAACALA